MKIQVEKKTDLGVEEIEHETWTMCSRYVMENVLN